MYCEKCGNIIIENAKYCEKCGTQINLKNQNKTITKKEYTFSGDITGKSKVIIDNDRIIIERNNLLSAISKGLTGSKSIRIDQITGTQYKKAGIVVGYLQFIIKGSQEVKGGIREAKKDENTIVWGVKSQNKFAEEIIDYINNYNHNYNHNENVINVQSKMIQEDKYDKLIKLKKLLDSNIITNDEFKIEKEKILKQ